MNLSKSLKLVVAAVLVIATLSLGAAALTAGASGATTTYYACLKTKAGTLSKVGTVAPNCANGSQVISWGAQGAAGPPGADGTSVTSASLPTGDPNCANGGSSFTSASGLTYACNGADGPSGPSGSNGTNGTNGTAVLSGTGVPSSNAVSDVGDFFIDTSTWTIYGPATPVLPCFFICTVDWGDGTSLVGPSGASGNTILNGAGTPPSTEGSVGDFYLDTSDHVLYGPATRSCTPLPCQTYWGSGVSLVGPSGQGSAYDAFQDAGDNGVNLGINVPSGRSTEIATLTVPVGGDYSVVARAEAQNDESGTTSAWSCELEAANPGGSAVTLDSITATGYSTLGASLTPIPLQGVVSVAAGATMSIWCSEAAAQKDDSVAQAHITATQVSNFSESS